MGTDKKGLSIGGRIIPWSFVYLVYNKCGRDWMQAKDCFWKARHIQGPAGIERYIRAGFKPRNGGVPYMLQPSKDIQQPGGSEKIAAWFDGLYDRTAAPRKLELFKKTSGPIIRSADPTQLKDLFSSALLLGGEP